MKRFKALNGHLLDRCLAQMNFFLSASGGTFSPSTHVMSLHWRQTKGVFMLVPRSSFSIRMADFSVFTAPIWKREHTVSQRWQPLHFFLSTLILI